MSPLNLLTIVIVLSTLAGAPAARPQDRIDPPAWPWGADENTVLRAARRGDRAALEFFGLTDPSQMYRLQPSKSVAVHDPRMPRRTSSSFLKTGVPNVRADDPTEMLDRVGEEQDEVVTTMCMDTIVVAWNDTRVDSAGMQPTSGCGVGFSYSTDGGASFVDGGNPPSLLPADMPYCDASLACDGRGNWYLACL